MSEQAQLPSFEELRRTRNPYPDHTPEADRIFWTLNGPLHSSVWIQSHGSLKPYAQGTDELNPNWHPISQCPLTEPKVSSITVTVDELDIWEAEWVSYHQRHADPPDPQLDEPYVCEGYRYGPLLDYDPDLDGESRLHLLECCGMLRPRGVVSSIVVKPSPGNEFVTIHDYLTTVHAFLLASRDDILAAMSACEPEILPAETKLMVNHNMLDCLMILLEEENSAEWWNCFRRTRPSNLVDDD
ncbi:hypothetical protein F5B17DRAFT_436772 [Nemania serpens]|nr:hypothetical protein F5B17DRAFT_436772 [Nemania serpens]